jgi:hypothetical protein
MYGTWLPQIALLIRTWTVNEKLTIFMLVVTTNTLKLNCMPFRHQRLVVEFSRFLNKRQLFP